MKISGKMKRGNMMILKRRIRNMMMIVMKNRMNRVVEKKNRKKQFFPFSIHSNNVRLCH